MRKVFKVKVDDKEVELAVVKPTNNQTRQANFVYSRSFAEALENKVYARQALDNLLRKQNLWDDDKQKELEGILDRLDKNSKKLKKGGIKLKEAKELAIQMRIDRYRLRLMNIDRNNLDANSAESLAEQDKFNYLVSVCTVYSDTGQPFFKDLADYLAQSTEDAGFQAATHFGNLFYGVKEDFQKTLPENEFLLKHKLVDEKLNLIDKDGNLVDIDGKRINEKGQYLDENGEVIKEEDEESSPFLDDDGKPIV